MPETAHSAYDMISGMTPSLRPGVFVFVTTTDPDLAHSLRPEALSTFVEEEGISMVVPVEVARELNLGTDQAMGCITLNVYSSLEGVGLTAAVSKALGDNAIPCNMIAAFHHDHVFVPSAQAEQAMDVLRSLQEQAAKA